MFISSEILRKVFPSARTDVVNTLVKSQVAFHDVGVSTPLRLAMFFAQCGHETGGLTKLSEVGNSSLYKGRGLIQLTGKSNYEWIGDKLGVNLVGDPNKVLESPYYLTTALKFWSLMKLNEYADKDDIRGATRKINGGYNGLAERTNYYLKLKRLLLDG